MTKKVHRLFEQFQPRHYILDIKVDDSKMTFNGKVIISGQKVGRPSQRLTFHQKNLRITSAKIIKHDKKGDQDIKIDRINTHNKFDQLRIHANQMIYPGQYTVILSFSGKITKPMDGIYPCFFKHDGKEKKLIATQFESHFARQVFPCIDEPQAKATFDLILTTPKTKTVLANTPIKEQKSSGNLLITSFETTPHMSTYLLAFTYGDLEYQEAHTKNGIKLRVYATPDNVKFTNFALKTAIKCIEFYQSYFGIDFPLPKCDFVALPDFAAGAMENWGLITFREQALLFDPNKSSIAGKQYIATVIAHELAHQWFGNLVTMSWWTDLWLNEGFASWVEYLAVDHMFPDWEMWTQFIVDTQHPALKLDALEHTHSIEVPVNHPDEIRSIFDTISYNKGASAIHMLYKYLGPKSFRIGLRYYLEKFAYKNTQTLDLWEALETASDKPVKDFMHDWIAQPGFPLLHVEIDGLNINISQEQFFINPKHKKTAQQIWPIPLLLNLHDDSRFPELLTNSSQDLLSDGKLATDTVTTNKYIVNVTDSPGDTEIAGTSNLTSHDKFPPLFETSNIKFKSKDISNLKFNLGQNGFYRVTYNTSHLLRLGKLIRLGHMEPLDRLGLLQDLTETAKAGKSDTTDALEFMSNFHNENNYAVWDIIATTIGSIRLVMDDEELRDIIKPFILNLISPQLDRLGWTRKKSESHFDSLLRPLILGLAASADDPMVVKKCLALFNNLDEGHKIDSDLQIIPNRGNLKRGGDIDPDLRGIILGTSARLGNQDTFNKLVKLHNNSTSSEERQAFSAAITGFSQQEIIEQALSMINSKDVRLQDSSHWLAYSFLNRHAKKITWQWLIENYSWLKENSGNDSAFYYIPIYSARSFSDKNFLNDYRKFFQSVMEPALVRSFKQGSEMIEWQSSWKQRELKKLKTYFASNATKAHISTKQR